MIYDLLKEICTIIQKNMSQLVLGYGWNLSNLIKYKNIDLLNFNRIKKLKLINEI